MMVRSLLFLLPLGLWAGLIICRRWSSRKITATFLGFAWAFHVSLLITIVFVDNDWVSFSLSDTLFYGVPLDWIIAQSVAIGALAPTVRSPKGQSALRLLLQAGLLALFYMFYGISYADASPWWPVLLVFVLAAVPAMLLAHWTATDTHTGKRCLLQSVIWAVSLFWLLPALIFFLTGKDWSGLLHRDLLSLVMFLLPLLLPGYLLVNALYHFAVQGNGTAFPYDPPRHLVTRGVYRHIANPMQVGVTLAMAWWGVVIQSVWVSVSALVAVVLFLVFRDVCDGSCAIGRDNPEWEEYQRSVPKWIPWRRRAK